MIIERFGKSFRDIASLKTSFFEENAIHLEKTLRLARLYTAQPNRLRCKICENDLPKLPSFTKHLVPYVFCPNCSHLNGMHEDSDEFCREVYTNDGGKEYAINYSAADVLTFMKRRDSIHLPKAKFLLEALGKVGEDVGKLNFADMGAGAGYMVSAMHELGFANTRGYEVGKAQVDLGNKILDGAPLELIDLSDTVHLCETLEVDVMTFIGVFEHLQKPRDVLKALKGNRSVRYLYFCVPMFSPTIYNEMAFPNVMPRQLAIAHTHLFTRGSIAHFENEFGMKSVAAWWFGTDIMDYYRSLSVTLRGNPELSRMVDPWTNEFEGIIDSLQLAVDNARQSSQVHMLMKIDP